MAPLTAGNEPLVSRPIDLSLDGHHIDFHFDLALVAITILFVLMVSIMAVALVKHRASVGHQAKYDHGSSRKATGMVAAVCLGIFFLVDGALLVLSFHDLNATFWNWPKGKETVQVEVMAQQWGWNFRYTGKDGVFGTSDDIVTFNELHVPIDRPIYVRMKSADVIHSFYVPNARLKQDVVPGMFTQMWFQFSSKELKAEELPAHLDIGCAQHCGANHYKMHATLLVESEDEFTKWQSSMEQDANRRRTSIAIKDEKGNDVACKAAADCGSPGWNDCDLTNTVEDSVSKQKVSAPRCVTYELDVASNWGWDWK